MPRDKIQLATKFGVVKKSLEEITVKGTPEYVRFCCEASLKRLNVDYIDLYYQHRVDTTVPIEDTVSVTTPLYVCFVSSSLFIIFLRLCFDEFVVEVI